MSTQTPRLEDLTPEQLDAMSDEELATLGEAAFGGEAAAEGDEPAMPPAPEAPPAPTVDPAAPPNAGTDPTEAMRQLEAELARERQEREALLAALKDPARVRAHLAAIAPPEPEQPAAPVAPDWDEDPQAAIQFMIEQATAPLLSEVQTLREREAQREAQMQQQQLRMQLAAKYGQDFETTLSMFDQQQPHLANLHPEVRYLAARGLQAQTKPADDDARIKAAAEALLAERLKAGGRGPAGVPTLGGAPQGANEEAPSDLTQMGFDALMGLPMDKMLEVGRKAFGGG
jgi:hypothetical protein